MLHTLLQALLPVIFGIALGWSAGKFGWVKTEAIGDFAGFVVHFALPFALFAGVVKAKPSDLTNVPFLLTLTVGVMGTFLLTLLVATEGFKLPLRDASIFGCTSAFPNMAYFGLPVLTTAVGPVGLVAIVVGNLVSSILLVPTTLVLIETHGKVTAGSSRKSPRAALLAAVASSCLQPLVWLPLLGFVLALLRVKLPGPVSASVGEIGQVAGGLALFTLGMIISTQKFHLNAQIAAAVGLKNFLQPALMLGTGLLLGLRGTLLAEVLLIGVMPSATGTAMFGQKYDAFRENSAATVFLSTLLAIATVAGTLALLPLLPH